MDISPMVTMITDMIGSPIEPAQKYAFHTHGQKKSNDHAQYKRNRNVDTQPYGKGISNEGSGGDNLSMGDVQHTARLVDQHKSQRRQCIDGTHHHTTHHQLEKITHAVPSMV